jgi:integrase
MACCGSRMSETLRLKWSDVDWELGQLHVGTDGLSKNGKARVVDFNPRLKDHLEDMRRRRAPDSQWVFPSPQRGERDECARSFRESLLLARAAAGLPKFGFHDCRHFFISRCVMSGIDFMTVARWVGHLDGGILIGKVYGHLNNEHTREQAQRINRFLPTRTTNTGGGRFITRTLPQAGRNRLSNWPIQMPDIGWKKNVPPGFTKLFAVIPKPKTPG